MPLVCAVPLGVVVPGEGCMRLLVESRLAKLSMRLQGREKCEDEWVFSLSHTAYADVGVNVDVR